MIDKVEHRLYSIEKWTSKGRIHDELVLTTPARATWYVLQGYEVFDFHESLEMEPEYYENTTNLVYSTTRNP
jgi:hypothetical protein